MFYTRIKFAYGNRYDTFAVNRWFLFSVEYSFYVDASFWLVTCTFRVLHQNGQQIYVNDHDHKHMKTHLTDISDGNEF